MILSGWDIPLFLDQKSGMYKRIIRPFLFKMPAEKAHKFTFNFLKFSFQIPLVKTLFFGNYTLNHPKLEREVFGLKFKNPVGLAAGFDKDGKMFNQFGMMGFGFIEVGTVTPRPQPGNPAPRLFRLPVDNALINRMGFNNEGVEALKRRLRKRYASVIIGGNIGKNKDTPNDKSTDDYLRCFEVLFDEVHYFAVNVSSPNTPNLRDLQEKEPLKKLLSKLQKANSEKPARKPILLKIAPDLTDSQLDDIIEIVSETRIDGVIATNTTIRRDGLKTSAEELHAIGNGGLSGKPLSKRSTEVIRYLCQKSGNAFPVIGVGGIHSAADAMEKLQAGASLVQLYTGFIYEGPGLIKQINRKIIANG